MHTANVFFCNPLSYVISPGSVNASRRIANMINLLRSQGWAQRFRVIYVISLPHMMHPSDFIHTTVTVLWSQFSQIKTHSHLLFIGACMYYVIRGCMSYINIFNLFKRYTGPHCLTASLYPCVCGLHINSCVYAWCSIWGIHPAVRT